MQLTKFTPILRLAKKLIQKTRKNARINNRSGCTHGASARVSLQRKIADGGLGKFSWWKLTYLLCLNFCGIVIK